MVPMHTYMHAHVHASPHICTCTHSYRQTYPQRDLRREKGQILTGISYSLNLRPQSAYKCYSKTRTLDWKSLLIVRAVNFCSRDSWHQLFVQPPAGSTLNADDQMEMFIKNLSQARALERVLFRRVSQSVICLLF